MKKIIRKRKHIKAISDSISDLHLQIINAAIKSNKTLPKDIQKQIIIKAELIRKYERRLALINL